MLFAIFTYQNTVIQGFPQVLRTWGRGAPQNLMGGGGLKSKHGGAWGVLKYRQKIPVKEFI